MTFYRNKDRVVTGQVIDGKFVPVPPPPIGDAFDALLDDTLMTVSNAVAAYKRKLDSKYQGNDGAISSVLRDGRFLWDRDGKSSPQILGHGGVRSWVEKGILRDIEQLVLVLRDFFELMQMRVRLDKEKPDWTFDDTAMQYISHKFGARTKEVKLLTWREREAIKEAAHQVWVAKRQKEAEEAEKDKKIQEEVDRRYRIEDLIDRLPDVLSRRFFRSDHLKRDDDGLPLDRDAHAKILAIRNAVGYAMFRQRVSELAKIDVEETMIMQLIEDEISEKITRGKFGATTPMPLKEGQRRTYVSKKEFPAFAAATAANLKDGEEMVSCYCLDGQFCVTVGPEESFAEPQAEQGVESSPETAPATVPAPSAEQGVECSTN